MKRLTVWIVSTAAGVVLLFSYHTSTSGPAGGGIVAGVAPVGIVAEPSPSTPSPVPSGTTAAKVPAPSPKKVVVAVRTINGAAVQTRYGPVQVQIRMRGTRIVAATAIVFPTNDSRDQEINSYAVPQLDQETLQVQSAQIDTVSGASYTSDGYRQSLQSALDAAHR